MGVGCDRGKVGREDVADVDNDYITRAPFISKDDLGSKKRLNCVQSRNCLTRAISDLVIRVQKAGGSEYLQGLPIKPLSLSPLSISPCLYCLSRAHVTVKVFLCGNGRII